METRCPSLAFAAPHEITKNPAANPKSPNANFNGADGLTLRAASQVHSHPKIGAKAIIMTGLMFCSQLVGNSHPPMVRLVRSRAKRFNDEPACSKPDQKTAASKNNQTITTRCFFSVLLRPPAAKR